MTSLVCRYKLHNPCSTNILSHCNRVLSIVNHQLSLCSYYTTTPTRGKLTWFHSVLLLISFPAATLLINSDSVICLNSASLWKTPVTFIVNRGTAPSCFSLACLHITDPSSSRSMDRKCSLPLLYAYLAVSPMYCSLHSWHTSSYVTPVALHFPLPSVC